jgi:ElaB/YqjD/DUF883 family membrane-anchored ribosome-binding protein
MSTNFSDTADALANDAKTELAQLRSKVETLMNDRVTPALSAVAGQAEAAAKSATDEVRHQTARLSDAVQEQPLVAIGIAAFAGFVLAALVRR